MSIQFRKKSPNVSSPTRRPAHKRWDIVTVFAFVILSLAAGTSVSTASAVPDYAIGEEIYTNENDIPKNGVGYNVAVMVREYSQSAGPTITLPEGIESSLKVENAKAVNDQILISDSYNASLSIDISKWTKYIPVTSSFNTTFGSTYIHGTTKTFTQSNTISIIPKVKHLTATPYYYKLQMSGDRWIYRGGRLEQVNIQPNSFTAKIVYAQGWEIRKPNGAEAEAGVDYYVKNK